MKRYIPEILLTVLLLVIGGYTARTIYRHVAYEIPNVTGDLVAEVAAPTLVYGLPVDSFHVEEGVVKRNENLSDLLVKRGVSYQKIDRIARNSKPVFDVRKIKVGNEYSIFYSSDSLRIPQYFIYETDAVGYVVYELNSDSLAVQLGEKEVISERKMASGEISSSLWNAMKESDLNPVLAIELSEIYAWTIDFFGIQKGDRFKVIYDEQYVDGKSIGVGKVYAAQFQHSGEDYFAFRFDQDGREDFFDDKGNSLRKAFLKAPLKFSRISSRFSNSRLHPVLRIRRPHHGIDYAASTGTPVFTIGDGKVIAKGYQKRGGGNYLKIKHNSVYTTVYMHLSRFAKGISSGVRVKQGQVIGYVGATGLATGPHLDFRVYKNGTPVDPLKVKAPPVEPVKDENKLRFDAVQEEFALQLEKVYFPGNEPVNDSVVVAQSVNSSLHK